MIQYTKVINLLTRLDRKCVVLGTHIQTLEMSFLAIGFYFYDFFLKELMSQKLQHTIKGLPTLIHY